MSLLYVNPFRPKSVENVNASAWPSTMLSEKRRKCAGPMIQPQTKTSGQLSVPLALIALVHPPRGKSRINNRCRNSTGSVLKPSR